LATSRSRRPTSSASVASQRQEKVEAGTQSQRVWARGSKSGRITEIAVKKFPKALLLCGETLALSPN